MDFAYLLALLIAIVVLIMLSNSAGWSFGYVNQSLLNIICTIILLILLVGLIYRIIV